MKIEAARRFHFCAGHRVHGHESKCANLHGHNYNLTVYAVAGSLDSLGRVVDFSVLKNRLDPWLQTNWDHTFLIYDQDEEMLSLGPMAPKNKPWFICPFNPTAENMAKYLLQEIFPDLLAGTGVTISRIELEETENCKVVISSED